MSRIISFDSDGNDITCMKVFDALAYPCSACDIEDCPDRETYEDLKYLKDTKLYNADQNCNHNIVPQLSGGVKCTKCGGWFCY